MTHCVEQKKGRYIKNDRKAPPYKAGDCPNKILMGKNGQYYISKRRGKSKTGKDVYIWKKIEKSVKTKKKDKKKTNVQINKLVNSLREKIKTECTKIKELKKKENKIQKIIKSEKKKLDYCLSEINKSQYLINQYKYIKNAKGDLLEIAIRLQGHPFARSGSLFRERHLFNMKLNEMIVIKDDEYGHMMSWRCKINHNCMSKMKKKYIYRQPSLSKYSYLSNATDYYTQIFTSSLFNELKIDYNKLDKEKRDNFIKKHEKIRNKEVIYNDFIQKHNVDEFVTDIAKAAGFKYIDGYEYLIKTFFINK